MSPRRSRVQRTPTGKPLALTARDLEIFKALSRYRYLRSTYLHAFAGGASQTRFKERLGDLFHEGFLDRPAEQWRLAVSRHSPAVHELGAGGRRALTASGLESTDRPTWFSDAPHRQFEHSLMVCEVLASLELAMQGRSDLRLISWPEIAAKAPAGKPATMPIPDAVFGIGYSGERARYRFFAVEADRATMPVARTNGDRTSILGKLAGYSAYIAAGRHRAELGVPNLLVLFVTLSPGRATAIRAAFEAHQGSSAAFLVKAAAQLSQPRPALLTDAWERSGGLPMFIDRPD